MSEKPKKLLLGIVAVILPVALFIFGAVIVLFTPLNRLLSKLRGHRRDNGGCDDNVDTDDTDDTDDK